MAALTNIALTSDITFNSTKVIGPTNDITAPLMVRVFYSSVFTYIFITLVVSQFCRLDGSRPSKVVEPAPFVMVRNLFNFISYITVLFNLMVRALWRVRASIVDFIFLNEYFTKYFDEVAAHVFNVMQRMSTFYHNGDQNMRCFSDEQIQFFHDCAAPTGHGGDNIYYTVFGLTLYKVLCLLAICVVFYPHLKHCFYIRNRVFPMVKMTGTGLERIISQDLYWYEEDGAFTDDTRVTYSIDFLECLDFLEIIRITSVFVSLCVTHSIMIPAPLLALLDYFVYSW